MTLLLTDVNYKGLHLTADENIYCGIYYVLSKVVQNKDLMSSVVVSCFVKKVKKYFQLRKQMI
jgi:hypothetical protein